jgi:beta-glucosidase
VEAESGVEHPETTALIRRAGAEGVVLLKNEGGVLPLSTEATVAVVGPNAATGQVMGGGSAQINAHRRVSPLHGLRAALGDAHVSYALGCYNDKFLPVSTATMHIEYRAAEGEDVLAQESRPLGEVTWFDLPEGVPSQFRARLTSTLSIAEAGQYELSLASAGLSRLMVDGEELIENWENYRPGARTAAWAATRCASATS